MFPVQYKSGPDLYLGLENITKWEKKYRMATRWNRERDSKPIRG